MQELEEIIRTTLVDFTSHVGATKWYGLEREMVSYFALGFLAKACKAESPLYDPGQISVEVRVPGIEGFTKKPRVCKDLLIWDRPGMTCWDQERKPVKAPLVIMEWKDNMVKDFAYDVEWLRRFSEGRPDFIGFTVAMCIRGNEVTLRAVRVRDGAAESNWLLLPSR